MNPLSLLIRNIDSNVSLLLKNGLEYRGRMIHCDGLMNILLGDAEEYVRNRHVANYGRILVRGSSITYIVLDR